MLKLVTYQDKRGEHRWKLVARNGRIMADSAEGYRKKTTMNKAIEKIISAEIKVVPLKSDPAMTATFIRNLVEFL